eukprot:6185415-Pleurochrysis_carterae.AAC.1
MELSVWRLCGDKLPKPPRLLWVTYKPQARSPDAIDDSKYNRIVPNSPPDLTAQVRVVNVIKTYD